MRINILSVLIWVQTVCKGYQQTTKVTSTILSERQVEDQHVSSAPFLLATGLDKQKFSA